MRFYSCVCGNFFNENLRLFHFAIVIRRRKQHSWGIVLKTIYNFWIWSREREKKIAREWEQEGERERSWKRRKTFKLISMSMKSTWKRDANHDERDLLFPIKIGIDFPSARCSHHIISTTDINTLFPVTSDIALETKSSTLVQCVCVYRMVMCWQSGHTV